MIVDIIIPDDLGLNIAISTDVESTKDDVKISGGRRHQQQQEVKVCVAQQALMHDSFVCFIFEVENLLVY